MKKQTKAKRAKSGAKPKRQPKQRKAAQKKSAGEWASPDEQVKLFKAIVDSLTPEAMLARTEQQAAEIIEDAGGQVEPLRLPETAGERARGAAVCLIRVKTLRRSMEAGDTRQAVFQSLMLGSLWERVCTGGFLDAGRKQSHNLDRGRRLAAYGGSQELRDAIAEEWVTEYNALKKQFPDRKPWDIAGRIAKKSNHVNQKTRKPFGQKHICSVLKQRLEL